MMKQFNKPISEKLIWKKMVKHRSNPCAKERDLVKKKLPNGHGSKSKHTFYALQGSPVKAFAIRRGNKIHMYEADGSRWATYGLCTDDESAIKDEVAKTS